MPPRVIPFFLEDVIYWKISRVARIWIGGPERAKRANKGVWGVSPENFQILDAEISISAIL